MSLECGCFMKSDMENNLSFDSKELALKKANEISSFMNQNFCQKHTFSVDASGDDCIIAVERNIKR